jgi:hypothetical protein
LGSLGGRCAIFTAAYTTAPQTAIQETVMTVIQNPSQPVSEWYTGVPPLQVEQRMTRAADDGIGVSR